MKITFAIPMFNSVEYIDDCLNSVLRLKGEFEIIIINDGSTDGSLEKCLKYATCYECIKIYSKENQGLSEARNDAITYATGEYIFFLDSDDCLAAEFNLVELISFIDFKEYPDYIFFNFKSVNVNTNKVVNSSLSFENHISNDSKGTDIFKLILNHEINFQWYAWRGIVSRIFLIENKLYFKTNRNYEDMIWTPQVILEASKFAYYDRCLYTYFIGRNSQITSTISKKNIIDNIYICEFWKSEISCYNLDEDCKVKFLNAISSSIFYAISNFSYLNGNDRSEVLQLLYKNVDYLKKYHSKDNVFLHFLSIFFGIRFAAIIYGYLRKLKKMLERSICSG